MATAISDGDGDGDEVEAMMDSNLWGDLQSHIDLSLIFAKLPLAPFFRLRLVCQDWNRLAADRRFLHHSFQPPISDLYFVVAHGTTGHRLVTRDGSSAWTSMPLPLPLRGACVQSGLLYDSERNRVFDLHTRMFLPLPPLPTELQVPVLPEEEEDDYEDPLLGMTVDTSRNPYSFRVIVADEIIGTRIYDSTSGAWTFKPSTHEYSASVVGTHTCVQYNKRLHIRVWDLPGATFAFHSYDLERDEWDCLQIGIPDDVWQIELGLWRGRLYLFGRNVKLELSVWEMSTEFEEPWIRCHSMLGDLRAWLICGEDDRFGSVQCKFCGDYVLVYNCVGVEGRAVLYNLDLQTWEKVELPALRVPS